MLLSALASAQSPTPTPTPFPEEAPLPAPENLDPAHQPSAYMPGDTTLLQRVRLAPNTVGKFPVVLTVHPGNWWEYDEYGVPSQHWADTQLVKAGFLVFSIDYRLAPNLYGEDEIGRGLILGQHPHDGTPAGDASGRPPQQSNDLKQQGAAAYADPQCNGEVFFVGGSCGATHVLWCALDRTPLPSPATGWPLPSGAIKAVVGLSGPYDLTSWVGDNPDDVMLFGQKIENYTNTHSNKDGDKMYQYSVSPISLVAAATNLPPILLFDTEFDPVPYQQTDEMNAALSNVGAVVRKVEIYGSSLHAFSYWRTREYIGGPLVGDDVTSFLQSHE